MRFEQALARLDGRQPEHMPGPSLERIRALSEYLDHPELTYSTIHVAGTNGKTTTARVAMEIACAQGISTGLFTSPHLLSVTERFSVCGVQMTETEFAETWTYLEPYLELVDAGGEGAITYFEAVTALAFVWFADKPVGAAVVEVGMGGSWDATNLVTSDVAVVCPIGLDHVAELGPTITDIAGEKAGVLKPGKVAVIREQVSEAESVLRDRAAEVGTTLLWEGVDWDLDDRVTAVGGQWLAVRSPRTVYDELFLPLHGAYAAHNAAAAIVAVEAFVDHPLDPDTLREAMASATTPGRLEVVDRSPLTVVDGAHNPDGARALATALPEVFTWGRLHLVLSISANKDFESMLASLEPLGDHLYVARNRSVRTAEPERIAEVLSSGGPPVEVFGSVAEALEAARAAAGPDDLVLVTGSLFAVADAKRALASA
jgi:dihydrofolate synthase / folylpolyglutamate synthase